MPRKIDRSEPSVKTALFWLAAVAVPVVLILGLEIVLRFFGVGADNRNPFVPVEGKPEYVAFSPDFARRYFNGFEPGVAFNPFMPEKADDVIRVVALGGSSTAGFPYSFYYAFPARLQTRLESLLPDRRVEVINLAMTAVNSYTLWHLSQYLPELEPDAVVIYAGHNEYYGAYGAGSTIYRLGNRIWLKRAAIKLKGSALYCLLESLIVRPPSGTGAIDAQSRTMMAQVVGDRSIHRDDPVFRSGIRQFEVNLGTLLKGMEDAGVPVYLSTIASNLKDQPPLGSDSAAAELYRSGLASLAAGDREEALASLVEAKERDDIRFRAPEAINEAILRLAQRRGVVLVDARQMFRNVSADGIEGGDQFVDHLHPNFQGYDQIADVFFQRMITAPPFSEVRSEPRHTEPLIDPIDRATADIQLRRLKAGFPFRKDVSPEVELRFYSRLLDRYLRNGSYADSLAVLALNRVRPIYDLLYEGAGIARSQGDTLNALLMYRALLHWQPFNESLNRDAVAFALGNPRFDGLTREIAQNLLNRSGEQTYLDALGAIQIRQNRFADAASLLAASESINPRSRPMLYNMARLYALRGDTANARQYFTRFQRSGP